MRKINLILSVYLSISSSLWAENLQHVRLVLDAINSQKANLQATERNNISCVCIDCDFTNTSSFKGKNLQGCIFENCDFTGANLDGTKFIGARMPNCKLDKVKARKADFSSATADKLLPPGVKPQPPKGSWITFIDSDMTGSKFVNVNFRYANFFRTNLTNTNFFFANIKFSNFREAIIVNTIFKAALMNGVQFTGANAYNDKKRYTFSQDLQDELFYSAGMALPMVFCCTEMPDGSVLSMYTTWCQAPDVAVCKQKYKITDTKLPKWFTVIADER